MVYCYNVRMFNFIILYHIYINVSGESDKTICFSCGGGLKQWKKHDNAWEEHALYFSKCRFLIERKGRDFVERIQGERPATLKSEVSMVYNYFYVKHMISLVN